jgi:hypothetical protein
MNRPEAKQDHGKGRWTRPRQRLGIALLALTTLGGSAAITSCAINPATGARQFTLFSEAQEIEMGREYDPQIVAEK